MPNGTEEDFAPIQQQQAEQQASLQSDLDQGQQDQEAANVPTHMSTAGGGASVATQQPQQGQPQQGQPQPQQGAQQPQQTQAPPQQGQQQPQAPAHAGKAGLFRSIFETLAGPQTPKYQIDPNTGSMVPYYVDPKTGQKTDKPPARTVRQLSNSIVAGALTGMLAGEEAPVGSPMGGFARGYQATQAQAQQRNLQAQQQASQDMIRKQSIAEGNLKLHQLGTQTAAMDMKFNQEINDANEDTRKELRDAGALKEDDIKEEDIPALMKQYHITRDAFMRVGQMYPHLGPDGKPLTNPDGSMMLSSHYAIIDPDAKVTVTPEDLKILHSANNHKFDKLEGGPAIKAHLLNQAKTDAQSYRALGLKGDDDQQKMQTAPQVPPTPGAVTGGSVWTMFPSTDKLADAMADHEGWNKKGSIAQQNNNPGNLKFANQPGAVKGAPASDGGNWAKFNSPEAGRTALLAQLNKDKQAMPNASPMDYIKKYSPDGHEQAYVDDLTKQSGKTVAKPAVSSTQTDEQSFSEKLAAGLKDGSITDSMVKQWVRFAGSRTPAEAIKVMQAAGVPDPVVGKFVELHGGIDAIKSQEAQRQGQVAAAKTWEEQKQLRTDNDAQAVLAKLEKKTDRTPEEDTLVTQAKAFLSGKVSQAEEVTAGKEKREAELEKQNEVYLQRPSNTWKVQDAIPNHKTMDSLDLENELKKQGVKVPPIMDYLTRLARYKEAPGSVSAVIRKGTFQMSRQQAMDYIGKFINPDYDVRKYEESNVFAKEMGKQAPNTSGGLAQSAGTAAQHIGDLDEATKALNNGDIQLLNKIANKWGIATGKSAPVVFNAIAHKVITETEKVAYGGTPLENSLKALDQDLNLRESKGQLGGVMDSYMGLMADRLNELDAKHTDLLGEHVKLSKSATKMFADHGYTFGPDGLTKGGGLQNLPKYAQGQQLTLDIAKQYLQANGNDLAKAKQALIAAGWPQ